MSEVQQFRIRLLNLFLAYPIFLVGCGTATQTAPDSTTTATVAEPVEIQAAQSSAELSDYEFEAAVMLTADSENISVEEPGFACPTLFDFDDDGIEDLVVGQFNSGKMKWYRNVADSDATPEYAAGEWVSCGDEPAEVPGVS